MRFSCDSCGAEYMISDEKVGPSGVKVRCKRCDHVVVVKPAPATTPVVEPGPEPGAPPPAPPDEAAAFDDSGLDRELEGAFDSAFGDGSGGALGGGSIGEEPAPAAPEGAETQARAPETAPAGTWAPAATAGAEEAAVEWFVAVGDQQVGPLLPGGVKAKWESGEVGPDTLVWKAGMANWSALSSVTELAQYLAPFPRPQPRPGREPGASAPEPMRADEAAASREPEPSWKPAAASALQALASQEMSSMPAAAPRKVEAGSLVERLNLPEGGVEPTGMVPLHLKGAEPTGETLLEERRPPRGESTEVRQLRKSTNRRLVVAVVVMMAAFGGGIAYVVTVMLPAREAQRVAAVSPPAPRPTPAPAATPAPAPPPTPAPAPTSPPAAVPGATAAPGPTAAPTKTASPETPKEPEKPAEPPKVEKKAEPPARKAKVEKKPEKAEKKVAVAERPPPPPARKPAGDPLLEAGGEGELSRELSGGGAKRSVYVPPAPGSDVPDSLGISQVNEALLGRRSSLVTCADEQRAADPKLHGSLILRWTITPDGSVKDLRNLTPEYGNQPIHGCISGLVKSLKFPKTRRGREVESFPFKF